MYYGYGKRQVRQNIDWSQISQAVSTDLINERDRRIEEKRKIDEASQELGQVISNSPQGQKVSLNEFATSAAGQFSKAQLMLDRQLKSGNMSLDDYRIRTQNLRDSVDNLYGTVEARQKSYAESIERLNSGLASSREVWEKEQAEGFTNFGDTGVFIDPNTGKAYIGKYKKDKNGNIIPGLSADPNDHQELSVLKGKFGAKYDYYDVEKELEAGVDRLGERVTYMAQGGTYGTFDDIVGSDDYQKAESAYINKMFANPDNGGHILTDYVETNPDTGEKFTYTSNVDEAKKDPNKILLQPDPDNPSSGRMVASLTPEQKKIAEEALKVRMRSMIDRKYDIKGRFPAKPQPSSWEYKRAAGTKKSADMMSNLGQLYYGDQNSMEAAEQFIIGNSDGKFKSINRTNSGIEVLTKDDEVINIPFENPDGSLKNQKEFLQGAAALLYEGMDDIEAILQMSGYDPEREFAENVDAAFKIGKVLPKFTDASVEFGGVDLPLRDALSIDVGRWGLTNESRAKEYTDHIRSVVNEALPADVNEKLKLERSGDTIHMSVPGMDKVSVVVKNKSADEVMEEILAKFEPLYNNLIETAKKPLSRSNSGTKKSSGSKKGGLMSGF